MSEHAAPPDAAASASVNDDNGTGRSKRDWVIVGIFVIACFAALAYAKSFFLPVVLAFLVALTLSPIVRFLARRGVPEFASSLALVFFVMGLLAAGFYYLSGPIGALMSDMPRMAAEIERKLSEFRAPMEQIQQATEQIDELASSEDRAPLGTQEVVIREPGLIWTAAANAPEAAARGLFAMVLLLFLLASGDLFYTKLVRAMPTMSDKKTSLRIAHDIEREMSRYLATIALINASLGIAVGFGLWAIGMPNPALWGALAAVLNFIPYVGSLIGISLVTAIALGSFPTLAHAALAPAVYLGLTAIEGQLVTPTVIGRRLAMNPVAVFLAIAFWGWLWGIIGMLIAVPLMVAIKIFCSHVPPLATFADFLSAEPEPDPPKVASTAEPGRTA